MVTTTFTIVKPAPQSPHEFTLSIHFAESPTSLNAFKLTNSVLLFTSKSSKYLSSEISNLSHLLSSSTIIIRKTQNQSTQHQIANTQPNTQLTSSRPNIKMQFSVKTILAVAVSMTTLASAAPQAMELAVGDTTLAGGDVVAEGDPNDKGIYTCCAFKDCTVCADYGHINDCSPCGGTYHWCCRH
ncbi:hypothetical protein FJTKL_03131 [Diaporthe vaccinii]|uniref:Uncharacterized protein n=1 Tax=Diaporthe vaccinii TaxID=105482 RepID=A0ABR4DW70_9PEZI